MPYLVFRDTFDLAGICNAKSENGLCVPDTNVVDTKRCLESSGLEYWFNSLVDLGSEIVLRNSICELFPLWNVLRYGPVRRSQTQSYII